MGAEVKNYGTYVLGSKDYKLPERLSEYKVTTAESATGGLSYKISAKFTSNTSIGEILPFLEAGGSVSFTRDGVKKHIQMIEVTEDGSTRS